MRIGGLSGMGYMAGIGSNYSVSSIHGNPRSMNAIDKVSEQSKSAKPLAIVNKISEEEQQKIRDRQNMTVSKDYESVMQQMMNGRSPEMMVRNLDPAELAAKDEENSQVADIVKKAANGEVDLAVTNNQVVSQNANQENVADASFEKTMDNSFQMQRAIDAYSMASAM